MKRLLALAVFSVACGADPTGGVGGADGGASDARPQDVDAGDLVHDAGTGSDAGLPFGDGGVASGDGGVASGDGGISSADAGSGPVASACASGDGQALWRLAFPANAAGYATVEAWANGCDYSLADQACSLSGEPHDYANFGPGVLFNSSTDYLRVRFSAQGLAFTEATLYLTAHADGSGIPNAVLESPLYGSLSFAPTVPISTHRTYAVDWSDFLSPQDSPSLTAVTLRSNPTGLAVSEIELCVQ